MCTVTLTPVAKVCGNNSPGNKTLWVINNADLVDVPAPTAGVITTDLTLEVGTTWSKFVFERNSCRHAEPQNDGGSVDGTIDCFFGHDDSAKRHQFEQMRNGLYSVVIEDGNGLVKLVEECEFKADFDSGESGSDRNGYQVQFYWTGDSAVIYEGAIPEA
ncbi:hypothetical protein [uncultured Algoriphagus sp.]|uniref:hypothetical protein n=1 Tax=uncultured Algoriphagus sp. TaxID=417365 RepID=UPI002591C657|nr:hypothetical protein [uncultured Algoriphagus sp.]